MDTDLGGRGPTLLTAATIGILAVGAALVIASLGTDGLERGPTTLPAAALDAVGVILAAHLTLTAWFCARATGTAVTGRLAGCTLFLGAALVAAFHGGPAGSIVRTVALLLSAAWAACAVVGPEVEPRERVRHHGLLSLALLAAAILTVAVLPPPRAALLTTGALVLTTGAWAASSLAWLAALRRRDDGVVAWAFLIPVTVTAGELIVSIAGSTAPGAQSLAAATRVGGLFAAGIGLAACLAAHVSSRRGELLLARAEVRAADRVARERTQERDHEVINALFAIEGATATMARHAGRLDETTERELADSVATGLVRLRALLTDADEPGSARSDVLLASVVHERAALASGRGVAVEVTGDLEVVARGDARIIGQVVDNLLLNAVRHGGAGADQPVCIQLGVEAGHAVLRVRDDGPGIPAQAREHIFERGVQLGPNQPGQGLGLFVSRRLLRSLGGDLHVDGSVRAGACFVTTLPLGVRQPADLIRG